jgi:hypothetical protein
MKHRHLFAATTFLSGFSCFVVYGLIGSYVASDGTLVEPFGLIPVGWFCVLIGLIASAISGVASLSVMSVAKKRPAKFGPETSTRLQ